MSAHGPVRSPGTVEEAADAERAAATTVGLVPGGQDRGAVLASIAAALSFPSWFGGNLDALEDCLRDLAWLPTGPVALVWDDTALARTAPADRAAVLDVLADAMHETTEGPRPLRVVLVGPGPHQEVRDSTS